MKLLGTEAILEGILVEDTEDRCETGVLGRPSEEMVDTELFERARGTICSRKAPIVGSHVWIGFGVLHATISHK